MKTKKAALIYLESNYEAFLESLEREYKSFTMEGDYDGVTIAFILKDDEFMELTNSLC